MAVFFDIFEIEIKKKNLVAEMKNFYVSEVKETKWSRNQK